MHKFFQTVSAECAVPVAPANPTEHVLTADNLVGSGEPFTHAEEVLDAVSRHGAAIELMGCMEEHYDVAVALESLVDGLQSGGELGDAGKRAINDSLSRMYHRVDLKDAPQFSNESVQITLESVMDGIRKIWEAIKAMIKKSIQFIADAYVRTFGHAERVHSRAAGLLKALAANTGAPQGEHFEKPGLVARIHVGKQVGDPVANMEALQRMTATIFTPHMQFAEKFVEAIESPTLDRADKAFMEISDGEGFVAATHAVDPEKLGMASNKDGVDLYRSDEMIGGKAVFATRLKEPVKDINEAMAAFANVGTYVADFTGYNAKVEETTLPVLDKAQMTKIAKSAELISDYVRKYKDTLRKLDAYKARIIRVADQKGWEAASQENPEEAKLVRLKQKLAYATPRLLDEPQVQFAAYCLHATAAMLDYCDASLKHYK